MMAKIQTSLVKQSKAIGVSLSNSKLQDKIFEWIKPFSKNKSSFSDLNLVFFDAHEQSLPERFLKHRPKFFSLFESEQKHADELKKYVRESKFKHENTETHAYHGSMTNFLIPSKSKPINEKLLIQIFPTDVRNRKYGANLYDPKPYTSLLFGALAFPEQQQKMLDSLLNQLLLHHTMYPQAMSLYNFHRFGLITFLHALVVAKLICGTPEGTDLDFIHHRYQHHSHLFNSLFEVELLQGREPIPIDLFEPAIPGLEEVAQGKYLSEAGFSFDGLYPVHIVPRTSVELDRKSELKIKFTEINRRYLSQKEKQKLDDEETEDRYPSDEQKEALIQLVFWLDTTGKLAKSYIADAKLSEFLGAEDFSIFGNVKAGELMLKDFMDAFPRFREMAVDDNIQDAIQAYRRKLFKDHISADYVD